MLKSIKYYIESYEGMNSWSLDTVSFDYFNLVVGINSTGKSRMIKVINALALFIRNTNTRYIGKWDAIFEFGNDIYEYNIDSPKYGKISEILTVNGVEVLNREGDFVKMFSEVTNSNDVFSPPSSNLVIHFRRDQKAYSYLEKLYKWALNVKIFEFGQIHSYEFNSENTQKRESISIDNIASILKDQVSESGKKNIIKSFNVLGYNIIELNAELVNGVPKILIKESGFENFIQQKLMSQGMFRALALLIFIEYVKEAKEDFLILIDDLAEGLDFKRASSIGEYINSSAKKPLQFISTSNHDYLLNEISVDNWIILHRNANEVSSISNLKYPDLFKKFKLSGLAPFDLFTSSFINKYLDEDENSNIR
jgi:hypothetical protein